MEVLSHRIESINEEDKIAFDIVNRNYHLNDSKGIQDIQKCQEIAIARAINNPITVIWGRQELGKHILWSK